MTALPRFGVIAAMPSEAASCRVARWDVACAGIGPVAARDRAEALLATGVTGLVSWGTAGALSPALGAGGLVLYTHCVDARTGTRFNPDPGLRTRIAACLAPLGVHAGSGLSSARPLASIADKVAARRAFDCDAVDMETAAIAAVAQARNAPFIAIRAIVDPAGFDLPSSALAGMSGNAGAVRGVATALLHHPGELGSLLRLAWWYRRALGTLRAAGMLIDADWPAPLPRESQ